MEMAEHLNGAEDSSSNLPGLQNERGVALITVLVVLVLLCILGATVLSTSTSELRIAGNSRNLQEAFFTADAVVEFATTNAAIYTSIIPGGTASWPASGGGKQLDENGNVVGNLPSDADKNYNVLPLGGNTAKVKVDFIETGAVPAGTGSEVDAGLGSGTGFKANYFNVSVIATGPNNTQAEIESYIARIIPK
ncbi:MAG: PilX N-terminal domain-containing pilus assembly protein [Geobacteraceae bacterium]